VFYRVDPDYSIACFSAGNSAAARSKPLPPITLTTLSACPLAKRLFVCLQV